MVVDAGFGDKGDAAAELAVTIGNKAGVFFPRHNFIGVAINMQEGHFGGSERGEIVHRVFCVGASLSIRLEAVAVQDELPIAIAAGFGVTESPTYRTPSTLAN